MRKMREEQKHVLFLFVFEGFLGNAGKNLVLNYRKS